MHALDEYTLDEYTHISTNELVIRYFKPFDYTYVCDTKEFCISYILN